MYEKRYFPIINPMTVSETLYKLIATKFKNYTIQNYFPLPSPLAGHAQTVENQTNK